MPAPKRKPAPMKPALRSRSVQIKDRLNLNAQQRLMTPSRRPRSRRKMPVF